MSRSFNRIRTSSTIGTVLLLLLAVHLSCAQSARAQDDNAPVIGPVAAVAGGEAHTCLLTADGAVYCWGSNTYGQLGDGTRTSRRTPVPVIGLTSGVRELAVGGYHTCALTGAGNIKCWGRNNYGQLGDGSLLLRSTPVTARGLTQMRTLSAGYAHTCAVAADRSVRCWGSNTSGQLGDNTTTARQTPVAVSGLAGVQGIATGGAHTCARLTDNNVRCWGSNYSGQLGDGTRTQRRIPGPVAGLGAVLNIAAGGSHTCAQTQPGEVMCWGNNYYGQLGDGTRTQRSAPVIMLGTPAAIRTLKTGLVHTCVLSDAGEVYCTGWNAYGQLGDGTINDSALLVGAGALPPATTIAASVGLNSASHTCAAWAEGLYCWGKNNEGQLGDSTLLQRTTPAAVMLPTSLQSYTISGRIVNEEGVPLSGVALTTASGSYASTDASGAYTLRNLKPGIYSVTASKEGYRFSPARLTGMIVPPNRTEVNFIGAVLPVETFALDLPFPYSGAASDFAQLVRNWRAGGRTTSWFDHAYPDYSVNKVIWTYNTRVEVPEPAPGAQANRCSQDICYDGHNGIDFSRNYSVADAPAILAAAAGTVLTTTVGCAAGDTRCASGWGNQVVLAHGGDVMYYTRYAHLQSVDVAPGDKVLAGQRLGMMGTTGNSTGVHLHFGLYRDDGDRRWEDGAYDRAVDPFGWQGSTADPWVAERGGFVSVHLWKHPTSSQAAMASAAGAPAVIAPDGVRAAGVTLTEPEEPPDEAEVGAAWQVMMDSSEGVTLTVPPLAFVGQLFLLVEEANPATGLDALRAATPAFAFHPAEVIGDLAGIDLSSVAGHVAGLTAGQPLSLTVRYAQPNVRHLDTSSLALYEWNGGTQSWQSMTSAVDPDAGTVTAATARAGVYQALAPLRCPQDSSEPDDSDISASPLEPDGAPVARLLDSPEDEDWLRVELGAGSFYTIELQATGAATEPGTIVWSLFDADSLTVLATGSSAASRQVAAIRSGVHFLQVRSAGGAVDESCSASYSVHIAPAPRLDLNLPFITR